MGSVRAARSDLRRRRIGFIFQFSSLLPNLRAIDNVALPAMLGADIAPEAAYARAHDLLTRVGLSRRVSAFPGEMSGGEQRRVAVARALINGPQLLLADEPTSDLDEETEEEIVALLEALRREEGFALLLVTHNRDLAALADRALEMKQGRLCAGCGAGCGAPGPSGCPARARAARGDGRRRGRRRRRLFIGWGAISGRPSGAWRRAPRWSSESPSSPITAWRAFSGIRWRRRESGSRRSRNWPPRRCAATSPTSPVSAITDYDVTIYLENTKGEPPIYVMSPSIRAFVQVGAGWQEAPLTPVAEATASVLKVTGRQLYKFVLELRVEKFTELLPHYMHVRFSNDMLVSPQSTPKDELFQRNDNYFVYLKPDGLDDATILKDVHFAGAPPLWIWMPPH